MGGCFFIVFKNYPSYAFSCFFMSLSLNFAFLKGVKSECRKREKLEDKYVLKLEFLKTETKRNDIQKKKKSSSI